jgi:hypothetical protein
VPTTVTGSTALPDKWKTHQGGAATPAPETRVTGTPVASPGTEAARAPGSKTHTDTTLATASTPAKKPAPEPEKPVAAVAPDPTKNSTVLEDHVIQASGIPADLLAAVRAHETTDLPMELWQGIHVNWLMAIAPGTKAEKGAWAMDAWSLVDVRKGGPKKPCGRDVLTLVGVIGMDRAVTKS